MNLRRAKSRFNFSWIIVIALLILLYSSYFLLYIPKQEMRVTERGFRILEEYAENMHKKNEYYVTHIKNYYPFYVLRPRLDSLSTAFNTGPNLEDSSSIADVIGNLEADLELKTESVSVVAYVRNDEGAYIGFPVNKNNSFENSLHINDSLIHSYKSALVPIDLLMENLKFDKLFENIALLDSDEVINNSNGSVVNDISDFEALKKDTLKKTQGGVFTELEIQGMKTHVMILPIKFLDETFYLAGMIPDSSFRKKTRTINNQLLTIVSGILLLLLICMPILKIVFINRKERLNVKDAHNTTVSIILGTSLLALLFIGTMKYYVVDRNEQNTRIAQLSQKLSSNIENELGHVFQLARTIVHDKDKCYRTVNKYLSSDKKYSVDQKIYRDSVPFNEILFMTEEGKAIKAVTRTAFSNLVLLDLSQRNYFKNVKDRKKSWACNTDNHTEFESFFIESIKSYNTGSKETAVSFRLADPDSFLHQKTPYMAITTHLPSLYDQILPKDVAFIVIDKKGEVMYHSNQNKILHENFLVESNHNPRIAGSINYRTVERARITYNERQWLAQIVPLKDLPLYHITLIDLQYLDNKNTRLYLFTFYFILITFISVIIGMQIIQHLGTPKTFMRSKNWSFEWLIYQNAKREKYIWMLLIQLVLLLLQISLSVLVHRPMGNLIVQLILIAVGGVFAYTLFKKDGFDSAFWTSSGIIALLMLVLALSSLAGLIAVAVIVLVFTSIAFVAFFHGQIKRPDWPLLKRFAKFSARKAYRTYMFFWLTGLSVIPVVTYYYSIKNQEHILSKREAMIHLAQSNLELLKNHNEHELSKWAQASNGSDIDGYFVNHIGDTTLYSPEYSKAGFVNILLDKAYNYLTNKNFDRWYRELKSPLTRDDYLMALIQNRNNRNTWEFKDTLTYTSPGFEGAVQVHAKRSFGKVFLKVFKLIVLIAIPALLWILFTWIVFYYLAELVLGTVIAKWKYPASPKWTDITDHDDISRILLVAFNGRKYAGMLEEFSILKLSIQELLEMDLNELNYLPQHKKTIWISGLDEYLLKYKLAATILPKLKDLIRTETRKIIIEMPYDLDFIEEYFNDLLSDKKVKQEEEMHIDNYLADLKYLFSKFYRFTGSIDEHALLKDLHERSEFAADSEEQLLADVHLLKLQYSYIWNNLSQMEKLILFDLADDGMMNLKNRFLINRLRMKGLIYIEPSPGIFTPSFRYFLKYSVNQEETNMLEQRLSKEGKWKNTRYLILLVLVPLVAFMFISQGTSVERVVGILTGVVALFSGAAKLMDTNWLTAASKQS
ncbi:cache domain-containing protein [Maribellus sediminis]|uniref:cache domain-containing protein n=1 Tax=Maribellus sediminis TaxID=2696285 RepID=UPI00142FD795|nr:cache domain-containing protein [Maribellus sediminis]